MHAQILGNQINNTILLKHKLERTDKRVENNKLYPVHILSNQMRKKKKYSLFFRDYKKKERRRRNCLHMKSLEMKQQIFLIAYLGKVEKKNQKKITCTVAKNHLFKYTFFYKNRKFLVCPTSLPLYEIFYYDAWGEIKRHLNASPRSVVQMALSSPHHYLQVHCIYIYNILHLQVYVHLQVHVYLNLI